MTPDNQTLRQIVRTSIAGTRARVVFANTFGTAPLDIGGASIALHAKDWDIVPALADYDAQRRRPDQLRHRRSTARR